MTQNINAGLLALASQNAGASAPANGPGGAPVVGEAWLDTTSATQHLLKMYDGTDWIAVGVLDVTNYIWLPGIADGKVQLASTSAMYLGTKSESWIEVTDTADIDTLGDSAKLDAIYTLTFTDAARVTHDNSKIMVVGGQHITMAAGDAARR